MTKYIPYNICRYCHMGDISRDIIVPYANLVILGSLFKDTKNISLKRIHCRTLRLSKITDIKSISFESLKVKYVYLSRGSMNKEIIKDIFSKWTCKKIHVMVPLQLKLMVQPPPMNKRTSRFMDSLGIPWEVYYEY